MDTGAVRLSLRLGRSPESPEIARGAVRAALGRSVSLQFADAAVLCTSELVTNALVHTGSGCEVQMSFDPPHGGMLRVEVSDSSRDAPHADASDDARRVGGRGLQIVEETSTRWGTHRVAGGKVVTADLLHHRLVPPGRVADEVLELLLAALLDHRRHRREGRFLRLREPLQVALGHRRVVPRPRAEESHRNGR